MSGYELTTQVWFALASIPLMLALATFLWRRRELRGALPLSVQAIVIGVLCFAMAAETAATTDETRRAWFLARDALILLSGVVVLWFALEYASLDRYLTRPIAAVLIGSLLLHWVFYLPDGARLLWSRVWWDGEERGVLAPLGVAFTVYALAAFVLATGVLVVLFVRSPAHRAPVALILTGQILARVVYPIAALKIAELSNAANVLAFDIAGLLYAVALLRFRLFDLVPVARATIVDRLPDAMFVLDQQGRVADSNDAAKRLLWPSRREFSGISARDALAAYPGLVDALAEMPVRPVELAIDTPSGQRTCQVSVTALEDWQRAPIGRLVLLHDITELRSAERRLVEQERALSASHERERLARDLHDSLGQVLGFVGLQGDAVRRLTAGGRLDEADERLGRIINVARDAQAEVRATIADLACPGSDGPPLVESLQRRLDMFRRDYGIRTALSIGPSVEEASVPRPTAAHLLRIVEEAVTNAIRHGQARETRVALERVDSRLRLSVEDDGRGFEVAAALARPDGRYGLRFMRERAAELGGEFDVSSAPERGTRVTVRVPLADGLISPTPEVAHS